MKKLFIVLLLVMTVGCAKKYTKPAERQPHRKRCERRNGHGNTKMDTMRVA